MASCLLCGKAVLDHDLCKQCSGVIDAISQGIEEDRHIRRAWQDFIDVMIERGYLVVKDKRRKIIDIQSEVDLSKPREFIDPLRGKRAWRKPYDPNNPFRL